MALVRDRTVIPPTKIDTLQAILNYWQRVPELRLGQLLENARITGGVHGKDLFYVDDADLVMAVEKFVEQTLTEENGRSETPVHTTP